MILVRFCRWDGRRCYRSSCANVDVSGSVVVCFRHRNPLGYHQVRLVKPNSVRS